MLRQRFCNRLKMGKKTNIIIIHHSPLSPDSTTEKGQSLITWSKLNSSYCFSIDLWQQVSRSMDLEMQYICNGFLFCAGHLSPKQLGNDATKSSSSSSSVQHRGSDFLENDGTKSSSSSS